MLVVDNDYKIFDLTGKLVYHANLKHTNVFNVSWRPGVYKKLPLLPKMSEFIKGVPVDMFAKPRKIMKRRGGSNFTNILTNI